MSTIPFRQRLGIFLGLLEVKQQNASYSSMETLTSQEQIIIATEEALISAMQLIVFQTEVWNDLCADLLEHGIPVEMSIDAQKEYYEIFTRLRASLKVASENAQLEHMKGFVQ